MENKSLDVKRVELKRSLATRSRERGKRINYLRASASVYEVGRTETFPNSKTHLTIRRTKIRGQVCEKPPSRALSTKRQYRQSVWIKKKLTVPRGKTEFPSLGPFLYLLDAPRVINTGGSLRFAEAAFEWIYFRRSLIIRNIYLSRRCHANFFFFPSRFYSLTLI
ncbi:hypothetical protein PUN28_018727 [Cardiocondyla obscurior]|uniref:Uncharacterized protein n=1 Tax=Cardiocondyla obscurior TaxID=286306 RepID=A0AAW2EFA6_9HYME